MTPEETIAKFATALDHFEPITEQPSDTDLARLWEAVAPLPLQIPYDKTGGKHNLIGLIRSKLAYVARYGQSFPEPKSVRAYDLEIDNDATAVVRARQEAAHKSRRADRATLETAQQDTSHFMLAVVAGTWVRELRDPDTIYTEVGPQYLFAHLQAGCTGRHALNLLALHNEMQRYHLEVGGIPEYINMLEDAQRQAGRVGCTITDDNLLILASTAMLTSERFPRENDDYGLRGNWLTSKPTPRRGPKLRPTRAALNLGRLIHPPAKKPLISPSKINSRKTVAM